MILLLLLLALLLAHSPQSSASLSISPLRTDSGFGCEATGVDLAHLDEAQVDELHRAILACGVLVVRDQAALSVEAQRAFSRLFGELHVHLESASHHAGFADVNLVSNLRGPDGSHRGLYGRHVEEFHSDLSWAELPTKMTFLKSEIRPDGCGDTLFADSVSAFRALPVEEQRRLLPLVADYSYLKHRPIAETGAAEGLTQEELRAAMKLVQHPVITVHPITGERNIFVNPSHTVAIHGLSTEESNRTLQMLFDHVAKAEFSLRHVWRDGDFVVWDNRATQHRATGCPDDSPRQLVRTTVLSETKPSQSGPEPRTDALLWDLRSDRAAPLPHTTNEL